ncbi:attractin-like protein 1 [Tubulanus polymorphus]|uniref:attractin-like protein 1 n=1 Tax=Tubulanus polymorphus TaxID=672921 RepID=UPI003DA4822A
MAATVFAFLHYKSKFRLFPCRYIDYYLVFSILLYVNAVDSSCTTAAAGGAGSSGVNCGHYGKCVNGSCICNPGVTGKYCDHCFGRTVLNGSTGVIVDGVRNYTLDKKCTWLIESGIVNSTIHLKFNHFATECAWDHLFIYDGNSVYSPLIAAYSGLLKKQRGNETLPVITTNSGSVYLYFYSDAAYNMSGFNISYIVDSCANNCSGHGTCSNKQCQCDSMWTGSSCDVPVCPNNCTGAQHGTCNTNKQQCDCSPDFTGYDCSIPTREGSWSVVKNIHPPEGSASHRSIVYQSWMYVFGGYTFQEHQKLQVNRLNFVNHVWENLASKEVNWPASRYGHTVVLNQKMVYMYGGNINGDITNELWRFDLVSNTWMKLNSSSGNDLPIAVAGHTAHLIGNAMIVIFGHSHIYGYTNLVQEFNIDRGNWSLAVTNGAIVKGGYGHSSVYDAVTGSILVHGGYHSLTATSYYLSDTLYSYKHISNTWRIMRSSGQYRYLHTASIISGLMLVFGGNTHNDTSTSYGAKCYSLDFLAYDTKCDKWFQLDKPHLLNNIARYGHSSIVYKNEMYIYGGFDSQMRSDLLRFTPGKCSRYGDKLSCLSANPGVLCVWTGQGCVLKEKSSELRAMKSIQNVEERKCLNDLVLSQGRLVCTMQTSCPNCLFNSIDCHWCKDHCLYKHETCVQENETVYNGSMCPKRHSYPCRIAHTCQICHKKQGCIWHKKDKTCLESRLYGDAITRDSCNPICDTYNDCLPCTTAGCMWCSNKQKCVKTNSYVASFPYGQCMEWMTFSAKCSASKCSLARTCTECHQNPSCGWCDDGSHTGLGKCLEGGNKGVIIHDKQGVMKLDSTQCPVNNWYFSTCPYCQCNGHSVCYPGTNICKACQDLTEGDQCQYCKEGYYGQATNGGNCTACSCNGQADFCDRVTGKCHCHTRGVIGDKCDRCDEKKDYFGFAPEGSCYYNLKTDYQFTFPLTERKSDAYYTHINFMNIPESGLDVTFQAFCSKEASLNITMKTKNERERLLITDVKCPLRPYEAKFSHKQFAFGSNANVTFFVYIYNFQTPFWVKISFSQHNEIDLVQFFIVFFSCFLALLMIAALLWKIKLRYDMYRRRRRMIVEMERMVSRPFAVVNIQTPAPASEKTYVVQPLSHSQCSTDIRRRKKFVNHSSPITLEPLVSQRAAILSVMMRLPTGDDDEFTPPGQSGICIASTLASLNNRRNSHESKPEKLKRKNHPSPTLPDTCI